MKFILGKKIAMSQKFKADGQVVPVTIVQAGPCFVAQVKKEDKDGYLAVQIGYATKKKLNKPISGHLKDLDKARYLREFRVANDQVVPERGQKITAAIFQAGDLIAATANSKGKGFQGVVKRHGFKGGPKTHGDKDQLRHGGSIGAQRPQRVLKNKRMAGRMGNDQVTVKNLEIIEVDIANNLLFLKGAVPGCRNALVRITAPGEMKLEEVIKEESKSGGATPEVKVEEMVTNKNKNEQVAQAESKQ